MTRLEMELSGKLGEERGYGEYWRNHALSEIARAERYVESGEMVIDNNGVARWASNNRCIPDDMAELVEHGKYAIFFSRRATKAERDIENTRVLAEIRKNARNYAPSREELCEMRAEFGAGTVVVNVITGRKIRL